MGGRPADKLSWNVLHNLYSRQEKLVRIDSKFHSKFSAVYGAPEADCHAILSISVTYTAWVTHSSLGSMYCS